MNADELFAINKFSNNEFEKSVLQILSLLRDIEKIIPKDPELFSTLGRIKNELANLAAKYNDTKRNQV